MQFRTYHSDESTMRNRNAINVRTGAAVMSAQIDSHNSYWTRNYKKAIPLFTTGGNPKSRIQGIARVLRPGCHQLGLERDFSMRRYPRKFDIIKHLPLEIVHQILINVHQGDVVQCVQVSRAWCDQVRRSGKWFRCISVGHNAMDVNIKSLQRVPWIRGSIEELELAHSSKLTNGLWLKYIKSGMYNNNIRVLKIDRGIDPSLSLAQILKSFSALQELRYTTTKNLVIYDHFQSMQAGAKYTKLKSLELRYCTTTFSYISRLLAICPNLRRFAAFGTGPPIDYSSTLITDICPSLKVVGLNSAHAIPCLESPQCMSDSPPGLSYLSISIGQHFRVRNTIALAQANAGTLKEIHIAVHEPERIYPLLPPTRFLNLEVLRFENKIPDSPSDTISDIFQYLIEYHNVNHSLRHLTLENPPPFLNDSASFTVLLNLCPCLQSLTICKWSSLKDDSIIALATTTAIEELTIVGRTALSDNGIVRFLNTIARSREHRLRILRFQDMGYAVTDAIFTPLAQIISLEIIELDFCFLLSASGLGNFLTNAIRCYSSLKEVNMTVDGVFTFELSKYPRLWIANEYSTKKQIRVSITSVDQLRFYV